MKRVILLFSILVLIISIVGCGNTSDNTGKNTPVDSSSTGKRDESTQSQNHQDNLIKDTILGYTFLYPNTYEQYSRNAGPTMVTDNVDILVMVNSYEVVSDLSQDTLVKYSDKLTSGVDGITVDGKKLRCNRQTIETYDSGKTNGFDYAKATGKLTYSIDNSECNYIAYYVLTEDSKLIYWVGVADSGYESELDSTMKTILDNFKKAE